MNVKSKAAGLERSRGNAKALLIAALLTAAMLGAGAAQADKDKPKEQPAESVSLNFAKFQNTYTAQAPGPSVVMQGVLHLVSQALLSRDGTPVGFTLHGNLANAFAISVDGTQSFVAVGADGIPDDCGDSEPCLPAFWTLTFRLVPQGSGPRSSLFFDLMVIPQYNPDGTLLSACVVGQDGCEIDELE
jgi:hypothetical protein